MLQSLHIQKFKSIRDVKIDLGKVNLFIGGNGSGKSNILEAVGVLASALNRGVTDDEFARKGVRLTPASLMKSAFKGVALPKTLRIQAGFADAISYSLELTSSDREPTLSFVSEKCTCGGRDVFGQSPAGARALGRPIQTSPDRHRSLWDKTRSAFEYPSEVIQAFDKIARFAIYAPQTEFLREVRVGSVADPPIGLHGEGLAHAVKQMIRQHKNKEDEKAISAAMSLAALPGWTSTVQVGRISESLKSRELATRDGDVLYFIDKYMHANRNKLSAYDSSEGTLFLLFFAVLLAHKSSPKIFALDNVDSALNPSLTRKLVERIVKLTTHEQWQGEPRTPNQVFLTSHNPTSIDAFDLFNEDQRIFVVARDDKGATIVTRLKPKEGWTREDWQTAFKGKKLSQVWIDGEISGALGSDL